MSVRSGKGDRKGRERTLEAHSSQRSLTGEGENAGTEVGEDISWKGIDNEE